MGSLRLTVCAALLAVIALAPAARAAGAGHGVAVAPARPTPGTDVALRVDGCAGSRGTAASAAFVADARLTGAEGELSGETRVRSSLPPGTYEVRIACADSVLTDRITVAATAAGHFAAPDRSGRGDHAARSGQVHRSGDAARPGRADPSGQVDRSERAGRPGQRPAAPAVLPASSASPVAPVRAGGGGTARFATVATSGSGPGTVQAVTGLALAGSAAAAVGLFTARRSREAD
ncbi:hypothetical protein QQY24_19835 [Streptomyces sp. TG1A-8]|uniref:hypothetical protein n=1 Tax=Streptomyces sp. TG1A-8 TaxID=3051385 RepID=UPI00265C4045|nr:hypothetical protein [Streptomyces sp. TG1A-8]MDO0927553.1 hypothetical protein [Streptomyces sp. TG1A-8]